MNYSKESGLPLFDGSEDFDDFIIHLECIGRIRKWSQEEKCMHLLHSLRGKAVGVLGAIQEELQTDYLTIKDALQKRFSPKFDLDLNGSVFQNRTKSNKESYSTFAQDLNKLFWISYGRNWSQEQIEILVREKFFTSIHDIHLKRLIWARNPNCVQDAALMADSLESSQNRHTQNQQVKRCMELSTSKKKRRKSKKTVRMQTCNVCDSKNHLVKNCPEVIALKEKMDEDKDIDYSRIAIASQEKCREEKNKKQKIKDAGSQMNIIPIKVEFLSSPEEVQYREQSICSTIDDSFRNSMSENIQTHNISFAHEENFISRKLDPVNVQQNRRRRRCYICHQRNHFMGDCPQIMATEFQS